MKHIKLNLATIPSLTTAEQLEMYIHYRWHANCMEVHGYVYVYLYDNLLKVFKATGLRKDISTKLKIMVNDFYLALREATKVTESSPVANRHLKLSEIPANFIFYSIETKKLYYKLTLSSAFSLSEKEIVKVPYNADVFPVTMDFELEVNFGNVQLNNLFYYKSRKYLKIDFDEAINLATNEVFSSKHFPYPVTPLTLNDYEISNNSI